MDQLSLFPHQPIPLTIIPKEEELEDLCPKCGYELDYQDCWSCGGEGGRGWEELQSEDPLWYSPDDFIQCSEGKGGFLICTNSHCK